MSDWRRTDRPIIRVGMFFRTRAEPTRIRCKVYDDWPCHGWYVRTFEPGTLIGPVTKFWHGPTFSTIEICGCLYINVWRRSSTPYGCSSGVNYASAWRAGGSSTWWS